MAFMAFRTLYARINNDRFVLPAFRALQISAIRPLAVHHLRAALVTIHIGNLFLFFSRMIRLDIFAGRKIRAGEIFPVTAHLHNHMGTAFFADYIGYFLIFFLRLRCLQVGILQFLLKNIPEPAHDLFIRRFAVSNFIQPGFQLRGEIHTDNTGKIFL